LTTPVHKFLKCGDLRHGFARVRCAQATVRVPASARAAIPTTATVGCRRHWSKRLGRPATARTRTCRPSIGDWPGAGARNGRSWPGHTMLVLIYHMLKDGVDYHELGHDYLHKLQPQRLTHYLVKRLESLATRLHLPGRPSRVGIFKAVTMVASYPNLPRPPETPHPDPQRRPAECRVEKWRGGLGRHIRPALSFAGASIALPCSVSTPRSSNRTGGFPASGSRRRDLTRSRTCLCAGWSAGAPTQVSVYHLVREVVSSRILDLVFAAQPPMERRRTYSLTVWYALALVP